MHPSRAFGTAQLNSKTLTVMESSRESTSVSNTDAHSWEHIMSWNAIQIKSCSTGKQSKEIMCYKYTENMNWQWIIILQYPLLMLNTSHSDTGLSLTNLFSFFSGGDFMSHPVHTTSSALIAAASVCVRVCVCPLLIADWEESSENPECTYCFCVVLQNTLCYWGGIWVRLGKDVPPSIL